MARKSCDPGRLLPAVDLPLDPHRAGGFDPRDYNLIVRFPVNTRSACFLCRGAPAGTLCLVEGDPHEVASILAYAGFRLSHARVHP